MARIQGGAGSITVFGLAGAHAMDVLYRAGPGRCPQARKPWCTNGSTAPVARECTRAAVSVPRCPYDDTQVLEALVSNLFRAACPCAPCRCAPCLSALRRGMSHALVAPPAVLITIPFSHYCEKARWGLDRAGAHYVERGYLPMIHVPFVKAAGGARMVPVLATREGVIGDSTAILRWCDAHTIAPGVAALWPEHAAQADEVARWEDAFDTTVGVDARRLAYGHVLGDRGYMDGLVARVVPRWQQLLFQCVRPLAIGGIRRGLRINDEGVARSLARLDATFVAVGAALFDGRRYLVGGRFTAADLTFAALSAPVLLPPELSYYYGARDAVPEAFGALVDRLRATPAGAYALRLYAEERGRIGAGNSLPPI